MERGDEASIDEVIATISERAEQAMCVLELSVVSLSDRDLEEYAIRLRAGLESNDAIDPAEDAAQRECARVQLEIVEAEIARRREFQQLHNVDEVYAPTRSELIGSLVTYGEMIRGDNAEPLALETVEATEALIREALASETKGAALVAQVLRQVGDLPSPAEGDHPIIDWIKSAVALELMSSTRGFAGRPPLLLDPVTQAEADRAKRLFLAYDRQDPRAETDDWPLDLDATTIANILEQAELARSYWHHRRMPEPDLKFYLAPPPREEPGRPEPHRQIVPEADARRRADLAGGVREPLVYPLADRVRRTASERIWRDGLPPVPDSELGWSLYGMPGDLRLHGSAFPHPDGVMVTLAIPPERILSIGRTETTRNEKGKEEVVSVDAEHEALIERLQLEAERRATGSESNYRKTLRELLLREGFVAIARYDYLYRETLTPQEMILLDTSARYVSVIRESIPSFVTPEEIVRLPRRNTA